MTNRTSIYLPADVAEEINRIHTEVSDEWEPKYSTIRRAVRRLADDNSDDVGGEVGDD